MNNNSRIKKNGIESFNSENYTEAIKQLRKIENKQDFEVHQKLGICYRKTRQFESSIRSLTKSLEIHQDYQTYFELARALHLNGNLDEAIVNAKKSLLHKETWNAYNQIGIIYCEQKSILMQ